MRIFCRWENPIHRPIRKNGGDGTKILARNNERYITPRFKERMPQSEKHEQKATQCVSPRKERNGYRLDTSWWRSAEMPRDCYAVGHFDHGASGGQFVNICVFVFSRKSFIFFHSLSTTHTHKSSMSSISKPNVVNRLRASVQQYSQRSEYERGQDQRHDDVVISGLLIYMSEERAVAYDPGKRIRNYKVVLDNQCVEEIVRRWGPGGKNTQSRKRFLVFDTTVPGHAFPVIHCLWTKGSREKIANAFPPGACPFEEGRLPLMSGLAYQFEAPASYGVGISPGEFVRIIGVYAASSFSDKTPPDYRRFINLSARTVVSLGPMDPVLTMHIMTAQGITTSTVPEYRKEQAETDWVGPQQIISPHVNDPFEASGICRIMGMDNFDFTRRKIEYDNESIYAKWGDRERELVLAEVMCADVEKRGRNLLNLTGGEILTDGLSDLPSTHRSMESCGLALPGSIVYTDRITPDKGAETVVHYTLTYTQPGMDGVITLPSSQSVPIGKERVVPLAALHFRAYPKILQSLGIASLENWFSFSPYLVALDFIMPSWINTKLSDKLPVNYTDQAQEMTVETPKPGDDDEDTCDWDMSKETPKGKEKEEEEEEEEEQQEETLVVSNVMVDDLECRVYTAYSVTPLFMITDARGFYSKGIPVSKETCVKVHNRCRAFLQSRADEVAEHITPVAGVVTSGRRGAAKTGGREAAVEETSTMIMGEFAWFTQQTSLMTHGIMCVNEGTDGVTPILRDPARWKNMVETATIFPVLTESASDVLFGHFAQFTPELGDEYVEFVAGPLLISEEGEYRDNLTDKASEPVVLAHRKTFVERWEQEPDKYAPLIDLVRFLGGANPMFTPPMVPLTTIVFKTNTKWAKGREAALRYYGPKAIGEEEEEEEEEVVVVVPTTESPANGTPPAQRRIVLPEGEVEDPIEDDDASIGARVVGDPIEGVAKLFSTGRSMIVVGQSLKEYPNPEESPPPRRGRRGKRPPPKQKESTKQKTPAKKRSRGKRTAS